MYCTGNTDTWAESGSPDNGLACGDEAARCCCAGTVIDSYADYETGAAVIWHGTKR